MTSILITGATSGIGKALALASAKKNWRPILVGRNSARLEDVARKIQQDFAIRCPIIVADISKRNDVQHVIDEVKSQHLSPTVWVNNAGFGLYGKATNLDNQAVCDMLAVNIEALTRLSTFAAQHMSNGHIVNVASTAAFQPGPMMASYCASKSYVLSFSMALNEELVGSGLSVHTVCPGPTKTGFEKEASDQSLNFFKNAAPVSTVVENIFDAVEQQRSLSVVGTKNRIMTILSKIIPLRVSTRIAKHIMK